MSWGGKAGRFAYPMVALLVTALTVTACGDLSRSTGLPSFEDPVSPPAASGSATPAGSPVPSGSASGSPVPDGSRPGPDSSPTTGPSPTRTNLRYVFPVQTGNVAYHPTHAEYPSTDIFADCGSPVVAVADGKILEVSRVDKYRKDGPQGPLNGGRYVSLLGDDGVRYYGSHLTGLSAGIDPGVRVRAGQRLGTVGTTGNANNVCHLHFGISPPCRETGDWWIRRGAVWPATYLDAWRKKANKSPAAKVRDWHREQGCPAAP